MKGLAVSPFVATQGERTPDPSLYIPQAHRVEDRAFLHEFMEEFSFVDLITTEPTLRITHIPVFLDRASGAYGTIFGHVAAQNPQSRTFDGAHHTVIVFRGPHGYISPTWYAKSDVVPTWNFAVVHAAGRPRAITEPTKGRGVLERLIDKFERRAKSDYALSRLTDSYVSGMMRNIVPFEMEILALEGKFKLGQERSAADKQGVLNHLRESAGRERSLYEVTDAFYKRGTGA